MRPVRPVKPRKHAAPVILFLFATTLMACKDDVPGSPETVPFTVGFPTVQAATNTDGLLVYVFDATSASPAFCSELISSRNTANRWPVAPLATSKAFAPCQLQSAPDSVTLPPVSFGERAVVVVGQSAGSDLLIGCQRTVLGQEDLDLTISLIAVPRAVLNPAKCKTLREHCDNACPN